jgi:hypothetical protein
MTTTLAFPRDTIGRKQVSGSILVSAEATVTYPVPGQARLPAGRACLASGTMTRGIRGMDILMEVAKLLHERFTPVGG